ncbi:metal-dependent transcriptional regulator [bacterium]|nr:metal-dependent transcriptional regulator [candidate division CSSED10-310 bacterium]
MRIGMISESLEDYLEIIYNLIDEGNIARVKDIAARKNVSMSSVTPALRRLAKEGLIKYTLRSDVELTGEGKKLAARIVDRHEFVKHFLVSLMKVPEAIAERDACIFEHYMSPETFRRLVVFFEFVDTCGMDIRDRFEQYRRNMESTGASDPCTSPDCRNTEMGSRHRRRWGQVKTLLMLKPGEKGRIARIQAPGAIRQRLIDMGVLPNVEIEMKRAAPLGDPIEIKLRGYHLSLRKEEAESIIIFPAQIEIREPDSGSGEYYG